MVTRRNFLGMLGAFTIASCAGNLRVLQEHIPQKQNSVNLCSWKSHGFDKMDYLVNHVTSFTNMVSVVAPFYVQNINSKEIIRHEMNSPSDDTLKRLIHKLHSSGVEVQLKPHLDLIDKEKYWRGNIQPTSEFMRNYSEFITHLSRLAEDTGCEQLCIGTELDATVSEHAKWYKVIDSIASSYNGRLTYAANYNTEELVSFWDHSRIDFIGSDFYYPAQGDLTLENITTQLTMPKKKLSGLSKRYGKKVLLTEFGLMPVNGANSDPHNASFDDEYSPEELELRMRAIFNLFWNEPWFEGGHAWAYWRNTESNPKNILKNYNLYHKPAERLLINHYRNS